VECDFLSIIAAKLFMTSLTPLSVGSSRKKSHPDKIDMTPMVDLGFLLITFFIFTATLSQPSVTKLIMPKEGPTSDVKASEALTLLLKKDKAFVYEGLWDDALKRASIVEASYDLKSGIGQQIREKQKRLAAKDALVVLIKPLQDASYQNVIAALDDMQINNVKRYAIMEATPAEKLMH